MRTNSLRRALAVTALATLLAMPAISRASFAEGEEAYLKQEHYGAFLKFVELSKAGDARAQAMVARQYFEGLGVLQDYRTAATFYERAANQGHATAQYQLARMYAVGAGVKQDEARAAQWMEKSANQAVPWAMYAMGLMTRDGVGVAKDPVGALKWISLAAAVPESPATADYLKLARAAKAELEASMSADRIKESQKQVAEWNAAKRTRDADWAKAINKPLDVRAPEAKPADAKADPDQKTTPLTRDYFPQAK